MGHRPESELSVVKLGVGNSTVAEHFQCEENTTKLGISNRDTAKESWHDTGATGREDSLLGGFHRHGGTGRKCAHTRTTGRNSGSFRR